MKPKNGITSVITGDIVQSRLTDTALWLPILKKALAREGKSPRTWQVYRGDSFQLEVKDPAMALTAAIRIKATIKTIKDLDVRIAIGIGNKKFASQEIVESDGEAFIYSGETFETLKKSKRNLAIKTPWTDFDHDMNVFLKLASIPMDDWTPGSAELILLLIKNPEVTQEELAKKLGLTQPSVSERQNRSHFDVIMEVDQLYRKKIVKLITAK
jgi:hypothetical protein